MNQADDKMTADIPTGDIPTGDKPTGDIPTGDKPTGDKLTGDKLTAVDRRIATLLIVVTTIVFANSVSGVMLFDDHKNVRDREIIHSLWPVTPILTETRRPSLMVTLAMNYAMSGMQTWSYHVVNVAAHCLSGLILFDLARRLLRRNSEDSPWRVHASWIAGSMALIWLVHPLQTQAVTYIIQRSESMMALCFLLCLYCLLRSVDSKRSALWNGGIVAAFIVGIGFKSVIISAPLVLMLFDYCFLSRNWKDVLRIRWLVYVSMVPVVLLLLWSMRNTLDPHSTSSIGSSSGVSSWAYLRTQAEVILHYVSLAVWPAELCLDYRWPIQDSPAIYLTCGSIIVVALVTSLGLLVYRPRIGFVAMSFFLVLAPTSSFIPITDLAFEHRMYLPLAALVALFVCGVSAVVFRTCRRPDLQVRIVVSISLVAAVLLGGRAVLRNNDYQSEMSMWRSVIAARPENSRAYYNLGVALGNCKRLDESVQQYQRAIELDSKHAKSHYNLGLIFAGQGEVERAIQHYNLALASRPSFADAMYNLSLLYEMQKRFAEAVEHYQKTLAIDPQFRDASYNLAGVYGKMRRLEEAIDQYGATLGIDPLDANASFNKASLLYKTGKRQEAIAQYQRTLEIQPSHHNSRLIMATILVELDRRPEAERCYKRALAENHRDVVLYDQFGIFLARQQDFEKAIVQFRESLRLNPRFIPALLHLGAAQEALGDNVAAITTFREVLRFQPDLASAEDSLARLLAPNKTIQGTDDSGA
ncbi:MAG: tetratricopeptide (TPR) repeat protein [Pirellulaceae bacterium]|jgi:tetratricopeptide (TPR) repeat protein